jgi:CheY-like chemotaxis protein
MPHKRVLLVDANVAMLEPLAAKLREHGVSVSIATSTAMACERARTGRYDAVIAATAMVDTADGPMSVRDVLNVELSEPPVLLVLKQQNEASLEAIDELVERIENLAPKSNAPVRPSMIPSAHSFSNAPFVDLVRVLANERRSGTLTITTPSGAGEVRLVDGEMVDAVYKRFERKKALARLVAVRDGTLKFIPGVQTVMRRLEESTTSLLTEAVDASVAAETKREAVGALASARLFAHEAAPLPNETRLAEDVRVRLRTPATLDEILDDLPQPDGEILDLLLELHTRGRLTQLRASPSDIALTDVDVLPRLRASLARAHRPGFSGATRVVFAATPARLAVFKHTVLSIASVQPSTEGPLPLPTPYLIATAMLGEGTELDIYALPLVPAYVPLWALTIAGAAVVVRLDAAAKNSLEDVAQSMGVRLLDARAQATPFDESNPRHVAELIQVALDAAS